jgi:hypothetical protein
MQHAHVEFAGMNPGKMQSLIDDLKTAEHTIAGFAGEFSAPLAAQGISTATVHQAARWTADQVSRLGERLKELRDQERTTPAVPGGPTPTLPGGTIPTVPGGTAPSPANPGAGANPGGPAQPGQHATTPAGAAGGSHGGGSGAAGTGAATVGGYPGGGGDAAGAATPYVPAFPPAHAAGAHTSAPHPTAAHQAAQTARHVSGAAQHGQSLPDQVWHDIERYASEPQFAAAFLAAVGAAGLTALAASISESRKKDKQAQEAARRQAVLDELTRSAGEHEGPAQPPPSPGQRAALSLVRSPFGDAPGHSQAQQPGGQQEPDGQPEADLQPQDAPKLSLVVAATGPEEVPAVRVPPPSGES